MSKYYGYAGKVLRVNLDDGSYRTEPLDMEEARLYIGGRGLTPARGSAKGEAVDRTGRARK